MRTPRSAAVAPDPATAAMALLTATQLARLLLGHHRSYVDALLVALVVALTATTVVLHRDDGVESRVAAAVLALLAGGGTALVVIVGLPGQPRSGFGLLAATTVVASTVALVLLATGRSRQVVAVGESPPYAS